MKDMKEAGIFLLTIVAPFCLSNAAWATGGISWEEVHQEIKGQDQDLIAFVDRTFDVAPRGGAMRPTTGAHAGEHFAPYDFLAKPKGTKGDYVFNLTFDLSDPNTHRWSVLIQRKWS
jgi:hypothetical protein